MSRLRLKTRIKEDNLKKAQEEGHITQDQAEEVKRTEGRYNPYTDTYLNTDVLPEITVTAKAPKRTWTSEWTYNDPEAIEFRNNYYLDTSNDFYKYIPKKKSGGSIHIKPENRGKFTEYCGGKVTDECIQRAKRSGNKKLIKRAVFAQNSRSWSKKHFLGGAINIMRIK